ncbi:MAG: hypothetical protein D6702_06530 [Planctomycetota bacterium]|nr:MAG: hypothetical protein D6702_06530 [Planctomycetota bacterium]
MIAALLLAQSAALATWTAGDLTGSPGPLVLPPGGRADLVLIAPVPCRSAGLWVDGTAAALQASWTGEPGSFLPLPRQGDLVPPAGWSPAGSTNSSWATGLHHAYDGRPSRLHLRVLGPAVLRALALVAIPAPTALPTPAPAVPAAGARNGYPRPPVEPRSAWGAAPPACSPGYCTVTHLAVHHTASPSEYLSAGYAECAANVLATQTYHMVTRGWCDIGYHYLICVHGRIWEGRAGGDDVIGAHDGHNCGSMATAFMGWFHPPWNQAPTQAMLDAMAELGAWKCDQRGIDPLGTSWYAGYGGPAPNLYGHRDVSTTACPGDLLYAELPGLRAAIDGLLQGSGWTLVLDNPAASFSGAWATGTSSPDKYGPDYRWASTGTAPAVAWWNPDLPTAGRYEIALWWPAGSNRNPATRVGLRVNGRLLETRVDQRFQGGRWNVLGTVRLPAGTGTPIGLSNDGAPGAVVVADALRLVRR